MLSFLLQRYNHNNDNINNLQPAAANEMKCVFAQINSIIELVFSMVMCTCRTTIPHFDTIRCDFFQLWTLFATSSLSYLFAPQMRAMIRSLTLSHSLNLSLTFSLFHSFKCIFNLHVSLIARYSHSEYWSHRCTHWTNSKSKQFAKTKVTFLIDVWKWQDLQQQLVLEYRIFLLNSGQP